MAFLVGNKMRKAPRQTLRVEERHIYWGHFFCPRCNNIRPYQLKPASVNFTFYYIPLFATENLDEFAVCLLCKKGFDVKVLEPDNQHLFQLAWMAKSELLDCTPETLRSELRKKGLNETLIDDLMILAQN